MADITLFVNGLKWTGWHEAEVTLSTDSVFGQFTLKLTRGWPGAMGQGIPPVRKGDDCRLALGGETVINGYINFVDVETSARGFDLEVRGRDKTGLLFKGAVLNDPATWQGVDALAIARDICKPFGIAVNAEAPVGAIFREFKCQPAETANMAITRLCRHRALYHFADPDGNLVLANASSARQAQAHITLGPTGNALTGKFTDSMENQHSEYMVKNQSQGESWGTNEHNKIMASVRDESVRQFCPRIIIPDEPGDAESARKLAVQTASLASGRARTISYALAGWQQNEDGPLWNINQTVPVDDSVTGIRETLLIKRVVFSVDKDEAQGVNLTLTDPGAYALVAVPEARAQGGWS